MAYHWAEMKAAKKAALWGDYLVVLKDGRWAERSADLRAVSSGDLMADHLADSKGVRWAERTAGARAECWDN